MERKADAELTASLSGFDVAVRDRRTKPSRQLLEDERRRSSDADETQGSYGYSGVYILDREGSW